MKTYVTYLGLAMWSYFAITKYILFFWDKMEAANTSFVANLWGVMVFIQLLPIGALIFLLVLEYEDYYKKSRKYDITTRKWVKK